MPAVASAAPAVLIAHLAAATDTIRVGSGGVMLPNHAPSSSPSSSAPSSPFTRTHRPRLGRAPGSDQRTARALRRTGDATPSPTTWSSSSAISPGHPARCWPCPHGLHARGLAARLEPVQRTACRHAGPAVLLRLPLRPALYRACARRVPLVVQALVGAAGALRGPRRVGVVRPERGGGRYLAAPSALSMLQLRRGELRPLATPEEAAGYTYTEASGPSSRRCPRRT